MKIILLLVIIYANILNGQQLQSFDILEYTDSYPQNVYDRLLFIFTLDGKLEALDPNTGQIIWNISLPNGPLMHSNYSILQYDIENVNPKIMEYQQDIEEIFLIEPLGPGYLYYMNGKDGLYFQKYPWTMRDLSVHEKPIRLPDGRHVLGSKKSTAIGILRHSGRLFEDDIHSSTITNDDFIWFGRSDYIISLLDVTRQKSAISWEVSYSEITPIVQFSTSIPDFYPSIEYDTPHPLYYIAHNIALYSDFEHEIFARNMTNNQILWRKRFSSPPVKYFHLNPSHKHSTLHSEIPIDCPIPMDPIVPIFGSIEYLDHNSTILEYDHIVKLTCCNITTDETITQYFILPDFSYSYDLNREHSSISSNSFSSIQQRHDQKDILYQQLVPWWPYPRLVPPIYIQRSFLYNSKDSASNGKSILEPMQMKDNIPFSFDIDKLVGTRLLFKSNSEIQKAVSNQYLIIGDQYHSQVSIDGYENKLSLPPGQSHENAFHTEQLLPFEESEPLNDYMFMIFTTQNWFGMVIMWGIGFVLVMLMMAVTFDWIYYRIRRFKRKRMRKQMDQVPLSLSSSKAIVPDYNRGLWKFFQRPNRWGLWRHDTSDEDEPILSPASNVSLTSSLDLDDGKEIAISSVSSTISQPIHRLEDVSNETLLSSSPLSISSEILGYGSHGTVVYKGFFDPSGGTMRKTVAIKRMLIEFYSMAEQEINLLHHSDHHPNIIRYYYHEIRPPFLYVALEWCPASLQELFEPFEEDFTEDSENQDEISELQKKKETILNIKKSLPSMRKVLYGLMQGLEYLHSMKIIHRDIKPANVLVSPRLDRLLLSDFGLGKKITDHSTVSSHTKKGHRGPMHFIPTVCGTSGWRAPEILLWEAMGSWIKETPIPAKQEETATQDEDAKPPPGFSDVRPSTTSESRSPRLPFKLQCSMDVFSAGCLLFYVLTDGYHPFGSGPHIESNVLKGHYDLSRLIQLIPLEKQELDDDEISLDETDQCIPEAVDLVTRMICKEPSVRPTMNQVLAHPYFWTAEKRLAFLQDVSDRLSLIPEYETADESQEGFIKSSESLSRALQRVWKSCHPPSPSNWLHVLDSTLRSHLMNDPRRKYHGSRVADLLRALRNKRHHYQDLPLSIRQQFGHIPDGFLSYWIKRFPSLVLVCWQAVFMSGLLDDPNETIFRSYYALEQ